MTNDDGGSVSLKSQQSAGTHLAYWLVLDDGCGPCRDRGASGHYGCSDLHICVLPGMA